MMPPLAGRYTIEREVGRGGMATVYQAQDVKHHREVAVKVLEAEVAAAVGAERFRREIDIAAGLSHPHILPLYDSGADDDSLFYVMPFVEGESLADRLARERQLPVADAVTIAREVADALAHAHAHGVIHRDIKPGNIMLVSGHAMVTDFGVALVARALPPGRLTASGLVPGTPLYMSPEQASGADELDGRTDVFSLGCVLYEMLTGEPPFSGATPHAILARKLTGPPAPIRVVRETVSEALEQVVFRALARTPGDRYPSAAELARDLTALDTARGAGAWLATLGGAATGGHGLRTDGAAAGWTTSATPSEGPMAGLTTAQRLGIGAAVALLVATMAGFVSTTVYDLVLRVPHRFTPTRLDFPVVGLRALIPVLYTAFVLVAGYVLAKQVVRGMDALLRRAPRARTALVTSVARVARPWRTVLEGLSATPLAELWFAIAIVAAAVVLYTFGAMARGAAPVEGGIFACAYRDVHKDYTVALTSLLGILAVTWAWVFRRRAAGAQAGRLWLPRWGGLALMAVLVLCLAAPWRLLWTETPRALLDGERYYIVQEAGDDVLLFNPRTSVTELYRAEDVPQLRRLSTSGYIFESETSFNGPGPGC